MTELEIIIDSPIGALLFVSAAISVFVILAILILKKGTGVHSILGYVYFFGIAFSNYASSMAYYEGLIPLSTIIISLPVSTTFLIMGIAFIFPIEKTKFRIKAHIISLSIATVAFLLGMTTQWYHFKVSIIDLVQWNDLRALLVLFLPLLVIGLFTVIHFLNEVPNILSRYRNVIKDEGEEEKRSQDETILQSIRTRSNSEIIYKEVGEELDFQKQ